MRAALHTLAAYPVKGRRIAVLGDMFELGSAQRSAHEEAGRQAAPPPAALRVRSGQEP